MSQVKKELDKIVKFLKTTKWKVNKSNDEGRVNSKLDEDSIIEILKIKFGKKIQTPQIRDMADFVLKVGHSIPVNIKTSIGSSDNATSKLGILYSFTDMTYEEMPKTISWNKMFALLEKRKKDLKRDYYYLCIDKNDTKNVLCRGLKEVVEWRTNPSNNLQINWEKEKKTKPRKQSFEKSYDLIVTLLQECFKKDMRNKIDFLSYGLKKSEKISLQHILAT